MIFRYQDPDNFYAVHVNTNAVGTNGLGDVELIEVARGKESVLCSDTYPVKRTGPIPGSWPMTVKVKVTADDEATVWIGATEEITTCGVSDVPYGGVALAADEATFDNVKVGYDNNADDDIEDEGDNLVVDEEFSSTEITPWYDANGNLTFDGTFKYKYDAWNP